MTTSGVVVKLNGVIRRDVSEYTVVEDSTPLDPSDTTGGFGQITATLESRPGGERTMGQTLTLEDGSLGQTTGIVRGINDDDISMSFTADSRIALLAVERTCQPFIGTLTAGITYHLGLCGITTGIVIDPEFNSVNVKLPGGRVNVYDRLKAMGAAYGFETTLVSGNVVVRAPWKNTAVTYRDISTSRSYDQSNFSQAVSGYYYNSYSGNNIAYPLHGLTDSAQVYQVDAGETLVYEIPLDASLSSVEQPVAALSVDYGDMATSQYSVVGSDGGAVDPATWLGSGGSVTVSIGEDTRTLVLKITGANMESLAPFRIAVPTGENEYYSSLRVRGVGVFWDKQLMTLVLNQNTDQAPDEMGTLVDSEFMETADQLYHRLLLAAERYGTDTQILRVSAGGINRLGESGSAEYPTIADVAAMFPGATINSIKTELGPTIADWNAELYATVSSDFTNQAYGNINGARVRNKDSWYRIRAATIRPVGVDYTAERNNLVSDVYRTGETIAQWNARWSGKTIRDVNIAPLVPV